LIKYLKDEFLSLFSINRRGNLIGIINELLGDTMEYFEEGHN